MMELVVDLLVIGLLLGLVVLFVLISYYATTWILIIISGIACSTMISLYRLDHVVQKESRELAWSIVGLLLLMWLIALAGRYPKQTADLFHYVAQHTIRTLND